MRRSDGDGFKRLAALLIVLVLLTMATACGDPGTGGSGVPTGAAADNTNTAGPGAGGQSATTGSPLPAAALGPQMSILRGVIAGAVAPATSQPLAQIVVAGTRVNIGAARFIGLDGSGRGGGDLLTGVPVAVSYAVGSDPLAAAIGAAGPALDALVVVITDPLPGQLRDDGTRNLVLFDDGRQVPLAASVVSVGTVVPGSRVRAWIASGNSGEAEVSRIEGP